MNPSSLFGSLTLTLQLKSLMEREALESGQSTVVSPSKSQQEELFLFPAESSTLTTLPGVARVVHSKASCTVHWLESGKNRPNAKELPAAQILGIHSAPALRTGTKAGRGGPGASTAGGGATVTVLGDSRRTETLNSEPPQDGASKPEEKRPSVSLPVSSQHTVAPTEEGPSLGPPEGGRTFPDGEISGCLTAARSAENMGSASEASSEPCKEEHNASTSSPETNQTPPAKPAAGGGSEEGIPQSSAPPPKERAVEQIREEGWSVRDAENVTLAELYLMFGKPGKLQLEYEWQPGANNQEDGQTFTQPKPHRTNRVLRCLLKLVATEVNPKPLVWMYFHHSLVSRFKHNN